LNNSPNSQIYHRRRLGRDYLKTGFYTECWFPENNMRYIALNDGIDTLKQDNDIAPFKNIQGDHQGKGKILIDEVSSETVKLIFDLAKQGLGASRIRNVLIERKVLTPSAYLHKQNPKYFALKFQKAPKSDFYAWTTVAVERILSNEIYIGNITHYKEISVSFKSKKRQPQPPDKWLTVENTHDPIKY